MIEIKINKQDMRWLDTSPKFIQKAIDKAMPDLALMLEGEAKKNFNGPDQLRVRTGHLRRSIVGDVNNNIASIGTNVVYGRIHELGGPMPGGWSMPKRPYLQPAVEDNEDKIEDLLLKELIAEWERQ
jgi:phage gpG-like protein